MKIEKNLGRDKQILQTAKDSYGYHIVVIHSDADDDKDNDAFQYRIKPGFALVENEIGKICKNLVAIVPIRMTEAWMIADKKTLKDEIGTDKEDQDLNLNFPINKVESIADPKQRLKEIIQLAFKENPSRFERVKISDLYLPLGQKVDLGILNHLNGYKKFKLNLISALKKINYIH